MKYLKYIAIVILSAGIFSCASDYIYEKELYKQVISLICSDSYNVLEDTQDLTDGEIVSYISVSCGGTGTVATDVRISIIEDEEKLEDYNWAKYDADRTQYAKRLPSWRYKIEDNHIYIPKGERFGKMKITFNPNGLSPDTAYFLPLAIGSVSAYEINPAKNNVLYRVMIKNFYAEQSASYTLYTVNGFKNETAIAISKQMQPLSRNKVRMMAGDIEFKASIPAFEDNAVVLEVANDNSVTIKPYKTDGTLAVTQLNDDPDYPNAFRIITDWGKKYKKFYLHYKYKAGSAAEVEMKEELSLEYTDY
ncbi:MAG: DUF4361 domain-containing protein [Tannerella sp.]|jgi:hypothetical protein|nr:DUF4361 domain-containing protein [Tannerella sp.]